VSYLHRNLDLKFGFLNFTRLGKIAFFLGQNICVCKLISTYKLGQVSQSVKYILISQSVGILGQLMTD
jgi:hypothetical protein